MTELDNLDKLTLRIQKLMEYVKALKTYKGITIEELEKDAEKQALVERRLELACEVCLDIARLVVTDQRLGIPENSRGYILVLGKANIIDKEFAEKFAGIAGFRNILVHIYLDIDYGEVADKLGRLGDFERFAGEVAKFYELKMSG